MRWVTYTSAAAGADRIGLVEDGQLHGLGGHPSMLDLLRDGPDALARAAQAAKQSPAEVVPVRDAHLRAPVPVPPSIRDFMAFEEHVVTSMRAIGRTIDPGWYDAPVFYFTNPAAVYGPTDPVPIAPGSDQFDYELEIAVVIGKEGSDIPVGQARDHIAGYTILSDWSARDLQEKEMRQGLGPAKGKDTATTLGPWLVTPDECADRRDRDGNLDLTMTASVNGVEYSRGTTASLHWTFEQMISYASRGTRLVPGDVLGSGTVGSGCILELSRVHGGDRYPWLRAGDRVRLEIERLGHIETIIAPATQPQPQPL